MTSTFEVADECRQSWANQTSIFQVFGPRDAMQPITPRALLNETLVLLDTNGNVFQLNLLQSSRRLIDSHQLTATAGATGIVVHPSDVTFLGLKRASLMSRMSRLTPAISFLSARLLILAFVRRWIDNVARRGLRRIGRILLRLGQVILQFGQFGCQLSQFCLQLGQLSLELPAPSTIVLSLLHRHVAVNTKFPKIEKDQFDSRERLQEFYCQFAS
jgi:hypothetical protein